MTIHASILDDDSRSRIAARLLEPFGGIDAYRAGGFVELPVEHPLYVETARRMRAGQGLGWLSESLLRVCREWKEG